MSERNGAEIIVDHLVSQRVPYLVGVCGHGDVGLMDAAYDRKDQIPMISVHNEQTAGFMADAYYRVTRQPLGTFTSVGPGSISIQVAIANAFMDSSAVFAITGNVPTQQFNRGPFQELGHHYQADFVSAMRPYVKRSYQATRADMLPDMMRHAYSTMLAGRVGPVHLDVPLNVFNETTAAQAGFSEDWRANVSYRSGAEPAALVAAADMLLKAQRPVVIAGNGTLGARMGRLLLEFHSLTGIPIATTAQAKGVIDETHPGCLGPLGRDGVYPSNRAARGCDVLLALGTRFGDRSASSWRDGSTHRIPPQKLIHVDIDPTQFGRNYPPALAIGGSAEVVLAQIVELLKTRPEELRRARAEQAKWTDSWIGWKQRWDADVGKTSGRDDKPIHPDRIIGELNRVLPDDAIVAADIGMNHTWVVQQLKVREKGLLLQSGGMAAMGMGVCGALGAKLAAPDRPVLAVCGDGGFMMHNNAVATAVEYELPVVWLVWNNCGYVSIRDLQKGLYGRECATRFQIASTGELHSADFAMMARSMGAQGVRVEQPGELGGAIQAALASGKPTVLDVQVEANVSRHTTAVLDFPPLLGANPNYDPDPLQ